jgi:phosphoglycerol transferase MdoB-like AlkP superfamily enzyme
MTIGTLIFLTFRILFFIKFQEDIKGFPLYDYVLVFLHGFRFDWSIVSIVTFPSLVFSILRPLNRYRGYIIFWKYLPLPFFIYFVFHLTGDIIYFQNANKHLGYEGFAFFGKDFEVVFRSVLENQLQIVIISFLVGVILFSSAIFILRNLEYEIEARPLWREILSNLTWIFVFVILARGGFQNSVIGASNAIVTKNTQLNQMVLNGVFTTLLDFRVEKYPKIQSMNPVEAIAVTRELISYPTAKFVTDSPYPLLRKTIPDSSLGKPNIVLLMLESWPAKYIYGDSGIINGKEITPNFNKLRKEGIYFSRFFANGGRTSNGLVSILTGIPDRPGISLTHTKYSLNHFSGLGSLLKSAGYDVNFYYGGEMSFENLTPVIKNWGFDTLYDFVFFQNTEKYSKGVWGFNDLDVYNQIISDLEADSNPAPKLTVCLSLSTHHPFQIPDKSFELLSPVTEEDRFVNSLYYADYAIGEFINKFKKLPSFENTIFIFVSDHTSHRNLNYYQDRNIPFLIYSPKYFKPSIHDRISSQIDILPTILGFINHEFIFSSLGRDVLHDHRGGYAYFAFGNIFGFAENKIMYLDTVDEPNGLNFTVESPFKEMGPCKKNPLPCLEASTKARAFLNIQELLLKKNLITP